MFNREKPVMYKAGHPLLSGLASFQSLQYLVALVPESSNDPCWEPTYFLSILSKAAFGYKLFKFLLIHASWVSNLSSWLNDPTTRINGDNWNSSALKGSVCQSPLPEYLLET
jgi:hypothetical protein